MRLALEPSTGQVLLLRLLGARVAAGLPGLGCAAHVPFGRNSKSLPKRF